jgi:acylphosphatase
MSFVGANIIVKGVVQGVGFRYWTVRKAQSYDLNGWTKNLSDGTVEIEVEGERGIIEEFIKELKVGPTYSQVTDLAINWYEKPRGYTDFNVEF